MKKAPPRRTQRERREETIAKLVQATIDSLLEVGYAGTTVSEICGRAGVSHGGLFRHFSSVLELVMAAGEKVAEQQMSQFEARFAKVESKKKPIPAAIALLRDACRDPVNAVFYELLVAARTDPELRATLEPAVRKYHDAILESARKVPGLAEVPREVLEPLLFGLVHLFDGESLVRVVWPRPPMEDLRLQILTQMVESLLPRK